MVGPAVDTIVTSMKPSRSPANRPAKTNTTVLRDFGGFGAVMAEAAASGLSTLFPRPVLNAAVDSFMEASSPTIDRESRRRTTFVPFTAWPLHEVVGLVRERPHPRQDEISRASMLGGEFWGRGRRRVVGNRTTWRPRSKPRGRSS